MLTAEQEVQSLVCLLKYIKNILKKYDQNSITQKRAKTAKLFSQISDADTGSNEIIKNRREEYQNFKEMMQIFERFTNDSNQIVRLIENQIRYKSENDIQPYTLETIFKKQANQDYQLQKSSTFELKSPLFQTGSQKRSNIIHHSSQIYQNQQRIDQTSFNISKRILLNKIKSVDKQNNLKQYAQLIDFFVLQFDTDINQYKIYGKETNKLENGARRALKDLLFSSNKDHFRQKKRTPSMTQIHKLTSNPSTVKKPIILPSFQNAQNDRYTYIFETQQCVTVGLNYFSYDRYYCFVLDALAQNQILNDVMKKIRGKVFQNRLIAIGEVQEVDCYKIKASFQTTMSQITNMVQKQAVEGNFKVKTQHTYHTKGYYVSSQLLSYSQYQHVSLILVLFYFAIKEEKIVILSSSQEKHSISEIILDLLAVLKPLKYIYPIVQSTLTTNHCQFLHSPMPMMIGIWGNQKRYQKIRKTLQKQLQKVYESSRNQSYQISAESSSRINQEQLYRLVIDLQKMQIIGTNISLEDCYILQNLQKYLQTYQKQHQINFLQALQLFIFRTIFKEMQVQNSNQNIKQIQERDWMKLIKKNIEKSQMYQYYRSSLKDKML